MNKGWTERAQEIDSFKVMDLLKRAAELDAAGHDVVHMEAGEPDFPTAEPIVAAAQAALAAGHTRYTPAGGIPRLRTTIAEFYRQRYGVGITPEQVLVTAGASGALLLAFALLAPPGSRFLLADPGYPCNRQFLRLLEARGQLVPVGPETNYQLTPELIEQHWQADTAGVLLASPSNPTGSVVPGDQLAAIAETVERLNGALIVDEIYHGLTYGFDAETVLSVAPNAVVLNSFSKYFGMTGWRLGWLVADEASVAEMEKIAQNLFISPPTLSQHAALAAFEPQTLEIFEQRREAFAERRDRLVAGLRELGFGIPLMPEGAFYVYADASHLTDDSYAYCWSLLEEDHLAVTPGADFGCNHPERYIRFSYTTGLDRIELALERLKQRISRG